MRTAADPLRRSVGAKSAPSFTSIAGPRAVVKLGVASQLRSPRWWSPSSCDGVG